jgi:predicted peptidase
MPLFVLLHHGGGDYRGTDNDGTPLDAPPLSGTNSLRTSAKRHQFASIILVPQMVATETINGVTHEWAAFSSINGATGNCVSGPTLSNNAKPVFDVIEALKTKSLVVNGYNPSIDAKRIYLSGHSMGGLGSWDFIARRPQYFAATIPMAGYPDHAKAAVVKDSPIWAFHHQIDSYNAFAGSNTMFQLVTGAPNNGTKMKLTKLTFNTNGAGDQAHFQTPDYSWNQEPMIFDWMYSQVGQ